MEDGWRRKEMPCDQWVFNGEVWVPKSGRGRKQVRSYSDLDSFNLAYTLAMEIFHLSAGFPKEERYALTDQIRRSSRSVCANLAEGFAKRRHEAIFKNNINNSLGEADETKVWLNFALDCNYLSQEDHDRLLAGFDQVSAMLWTLMNNWRTFL